MAKPFTVAIASCAEYQRLLEASQKALDRWNTTRVDVSQTRSISQEHGNELLLFAGELCSSIRRIVEPLTALLELPTDIKNARIELTRRLPPLVGCSIPKPFRHIDRIIDSK